jgi:DNA-binding transcriptional LysR family regulator
VDIRQLKYFVALVRHGSFSEAAARINIAQPSLSVQVAKLERELGCRLVERGARGVRPTEAGQRLNELATDILERLAEARDEIIRDFADAGLPVTLGIPPVMAVSLAVPLIRAARSLRPRLALRIVEGMSGTIRRQFAEGALDLAILHNADPGEFPRLLPLVRETLHLVGLPAALPPAGSPLGIVDVAALPLVLPTARHSLRQMLDAAARRAGCKLNIAAENDSLPQLIGLVNGGLGCTVLPLVGMAGQPGLASLPVDGAEVTWRSGIVLGRRVARDPSVAALCRLIGMIVRELIATGAWPGGQAEDHAAWPAPSRQGAGVAA